MEIMLTKLVFWHWFALAVILAILDVACGANFFFVWCGGAAALVGIILLLAPALTWEYQFLIFGLGVLTSFIVWRHYLKSHQQPTDRPHLNQRAKQYLGRQFTLDAPIANGRGKVRVDDTMWRVEGSDMPAGTVVTVIDVDGVVLKVTKV